MRRHNEDLPQSPVIFQSSNVHLSPKSDVYAHMHVCRLHKHIFACVWRLDIWAASQQTSLMFANWLPCWLASWFLGAADAAAATTHAAVGNPHVQNHIIIETVYYRRYSIYYRYSIKYVLYNIHTIRNALSYLRCNVYCIHYTRHTNYYALYSICVALVSCAAAATAPAAIRAALV